jgi:hypothetical protein
VACLGEAMGSLASLTVGLRARDLEAVLDAIDPARLPALSYLGLRGEALSPGAIDRCLDHPMMSRIACLDLAGAQPLSREALAALLDRRDTWQHLDRLVLPEGAAPSGAEDGRIGDVEVLWADRRRQSVRELDRSVIAGAGFGGFDFVA